MKQFTKVSKQEPCPICGRDNWCEFGDRAVHCMRLESAHPARDGGWYHFYQDTKYQPPTFRPPVAQPKRIDAQGMINKWRSQTKEFQFVCLATELKVTVESLTIIGAAWSEEHKAWAFPMFDGDGQIIGIRLRNRQGFKWAVSGSRQGIFLPYFFEIPQVAYLPEGPTDTAAGLSLGLYTIGRPTCQSGNEQIKAALKRLGIYRAVIVSDNDEKKKLGPREGRPGIEGAMKLKKELGLSSVIWMPPSPIKDLREFVGKGGTRQMIESDVSQKVWTKK